MKLSEERKELLRKNKSRIAAYVQHESDEVLYSECMYKYDDGTMCAASACMTDNERKIAYLTNNHGCITDVGDEYLDEDEKDALKRLQRAHDTYLSNVYQDEGVVAEQVSFRDFDKIVNELLA